MKRQAAFTDKENDLRASGKILSNVFKTSKANREAPATTGHHRPLAELQSGQEEIHIHTGQRHSPQRPSAPVLTSSEGNPGHDRLGLKRNSSSLLTRVRPTDSQTSTEEPAGHKPSRLCSFSPQAAAGTAAAAAAAGHEQPKAGSNMFTGRTPPVAHPDDGDSSDLSDVEVLVAPQASRARTAQVSLFAGTC